MSINLLNFDKRMRVTKESHLDRVLEALGVSRLFALNWKTVSPISLPKKYLGHTAFFLSESPKLQIKGLASAADI